LKALNGTNDFNELDSVLGMNGFSDSVSSLFDMNNDGFADNTIDVKIAGSLVENIPIINSTNTSSFFTGILWDSADGGSDYSGSEDIVFFTILNPSHVGKYGMCDFEIRLPSPLESLIGVTNSIKKTAELG